MHVLKWPIRMPNNIPMTKVSVCGKKYCHIFYLAHTGRISLDPFFGRLNIVTAVEGTESDELQRSRSCRTESPTTKLYGRRRYIPEKPASFFATYW